MSIGRSKTLRARPIPVALSAFLAVVLSLCAQDPAETDLNLDPGITEPGYGFRAPGTKPPVGQLDDSRVLEVGDKVSFRVAEEDEPSQVLAVASSGEIEFPLAGRVRAAGRTCREVAAEVERRLEAKYYR